MVAMVDLYYRDKNGEIENLNGMKMIFQNVRYADTNGEEGMANTSNLIYDTIDLYNKKHDYFIIILNKFNDNYS